MRVEGPDEGMQVRVQWTDEGMQVRVEWPDEADKADEADEEPESAPNVEAARVLERALQRVHRAEDIEQARNVLWDAEGPAQEPNPSPDRNS